MRVVRIDRGHRLSRWEKIRENLDEMAGAYFIVDREVEQTSQPCTIQRCGQCGDRMIEFKTRRQPYVAQFPAFEKLPRDGPTGIRQQEIGAMVLNQIVGSPGIAVRVQIRRRCHDAVLRLVQGPGHQTQSATRPIRIERSKSSAAKSVSVLLRPTKSLILPAWRSR